MADPSREPGVSVRGMRAARLHHIGGTLQLDIDLPAPVAGDQGVVVDLAYASVNPLDIWVTRGTPGAAAEHLPWTPGTEATGWIEGRPVLIRGGGLGVMRPGLYAERAAVPTSSVTPLPHGTDLQQVAGLGVAGATAWHAVHTKSAVTADDRVLVLGASGGVGAMAVQLARATGARVVGQTTSEAKVAGILAGGAERAIVADAANLTAAIGDFRPTVVFDPLGGAFTGAAVEALEPFGRLCVYGTSVDEIVTFNLRSLYRKGITLTGYTGLRETSAQQADLLATLIADIAAGRLTVPIDAVLPLGSAAEAHQRILDRKVEGKLLLDCRA